MATRILPPADLDLRTAIREAGDNEVFAIGDVEGGCVHRVTITCRGQSDRVVALLDRPRAGQVVIHNHPSGNLTPSDADMQLAGRYGENGVGVVIVNNEVTQSNWVVEPYTDQTKSVDEDRVVEVFESVLPTTLEGFEPRPAQIEMALAVTRSLNDGDPLVCEAGTGTGKSLAYLIPSALWAMENDAKVVISTFTRTLQAQLMASDRKILAQTGLDVRVALLQGRNNYLCKRRLGLAREESEAKDDPDLTERALFAALGDWSGTTTEGSRLDLPVPVDGPTWERVQSDSDLSLRARCMHFDACHYYTSTRRAAGSHLIIVNHALLLADLALKAEIQHGVLPKFTRLILDEAHHLEDAATGSASRRLTAEAVRRATAPLLDRKRRRGALSRLAKRHLRAGSKLPPDRQDKLEAQLISVETQTRETVRGAEDALASVASLLPETGAPKRITPSFEQHEDWTGWIAPTLRSLASDLEQTSESLELVQDLFEGIPLSPLDEEPLLDLKRARRRLTSHVDIVRGFLASNDAHARWMAPASRRDADSAAITTAPIEVAETLQQILWRPMKGVTATSATLSVGGSFNHWKTRTGLTYGTTLLLPSPFDHFNQALLGLPRDIPEPNTPVYLKKTSEAVVRAVQGSDGGAFVLCTSYEAVRVYARALREAGRPAVLAQGEGERTRMLERFMSNRRAVLVGTDSFWEGVSVKGDGLRLVILPRIPFRVPSDPLQEARQEHILAAGGDPFRSYTLPEAVLKLRQGYGRLIRAHSDRGAVLLLDTRVHTKGYGRIVLKALPPARRVKGPLDWVLRELAAHADQNRGS